MEDLHATFDALESDVADFKRKGRSRYQELQHEERLLEREMVQFAERCQHWDAEGTDSCSNILRELKAVRGTRDSPVGSPWGVGDGDSKPRQERAERSQQFETLAPL